MNHQLVNFLNRNALQGHTEVRVAEMACGSGFAAHLLAQEKNVILSLAADLNLDDYRQASIQNYQGVFALIDLYWPALAPGSFDLVWNSSSIEELPDPEKAVRTMAWLVKPGGRIFVGVPFKHGPVGLLGRVLGRQARRWLGRIYSRNDLRHLLESAELEIEAELVYLGGVFIGMLAIKSS
jgi:SAM-dependent methyltransferase